MISLRSRVSRKILTYFFSNRNSERFVNELARAIDEDVKNVHRKLIELEKAGLLESQFRGNQRHFRLAHGNPLLKNYEKIFLQTVGLEEQIKTALAAVEGVEQAIIYGSYADGSMDASSDIDILVIGQHSPLKATKAIQPVGKVSGRSINMVNITPSEFKQKRNDPFLQNVLEGKTIRLI